MFASITVIPLRRGHSLKRAGVSCLCFPQCGVWLGLCPIYYMDVGVTGVAGIMSNLLYGCYSHRCGWDYARFVKWMLGSQVWLDLCPVCFVGAGV